MTPSRSLLILLFCFTSSHSGKAIEDEVNSLLNFRKIILCNIPKSRPLLDYANYGCYCGYGGSGTPVDELDRCCQVHDGCYGDAKKNPDCRPFFDSPYIKNYNYKCDKTNRAVTCLDDNSACGMFICECDRKAAMCFEKAPYIIDHRNIPSSSCK
ncbi:phospholipase A2-like [Genypterus blacodes]|uniref:phospholipase A2-like n=1 Tax=Genypterus blacodes TaxID=154954 RepID=UPI003F771B56